MKLYKNMANVAVIVIETLFCLMIMNELAFHVVITYLNENMNSLKFNVKIIILSVDSNMQS